MCILLPAHPVPKLIKGARPLRIERKTIAAPRDGILLVIRSLAPGHEIKEHISLIQQIEHAAKFVVARDTLNPERADAMYTKQLLASEKYIKLIALNIDRKHGQRLLNKIIHNTPRHAFAYLVIPIPQFKLPFLFLANSDWHDSDVPLGMVAYRFAQMRDELCCGFECVDGEACGGEREDVGAPLDADYGDCVGGGGWAEERGEGELEGGGVESEMREGLRVEKGMEIGGGEGLAEGEWEEEEEGEMKDAWSHRDAQLCGKEEGGLGRGESAKRKGVHPGGVVAEAKGCGSVSWGMGDAKSKRKNNMFPKC